MSDFDKDFNKNAPKSCKLWRNYLRKCRILNKIPTKCAKGPQVMAQLLAEMSDFEQDLRNYLRKCRILIKIPTKCAKGPQV
jgi:hypothetical protein